MSKGINDINEQIARWITPNVYASTFDVLKKKQQYDICNMGISAISDILDNDKRPSCDGGVGGLEDINGVGDYFPLFPSHFCELISTKAILKNDLYLISIHPKELSTVPELSAQSRKTSYETLSSRLVRDLLADLKLKSMAFEWRHNYAISSHRHDTMYSKVEFTANSNYQFPGDATTNSSGLNKNDISTLGYLAISTDYIPGNQEDVYEDANKNPSQARISSCQYNINMPKIVVPLPPKPAIGTLRFIGMPTISRLISSQQLTTQDSSNAINPYDSNNKIRKEFDGWVFPGQTLSNYNHEFDDADWLFNGKLNRTSFTVPALTNFIKCNPGLLDDGMEYHSYRNVCPPHSHTLNGMTFDVESLSLVSVLLPFNNPISTHGIGQVFQYDTETDGLPSFNSSSICHWHSDSPENIYQVDIDVDLSRMHIPKIEFGNPTNTTATSTESHPPFTFIPVMVYVGGETYEYYEHL